MVFGRKCWFSSGFAMVFGWKYWFSLGFSFVLDGNLDFPKVFQCFWAEMLVFIRFFNVCARADLGLS